MKAPSKASRYRRRIASHIRHARSLDLDRFVPERGDRGSIAIVAGGPSLDVSLLHGMPIMVAGSAHDHLRRKGVEFDYSVLLDAGDAMLKHLHFLRRPTRYLVASQVTPKVFGRLRGLDVKLWHAGGNPADGAFGGEPAVIGGCTTPLRAVYLAFLMGYTDFHMHGLDSCLSPSRTHAYAWSVTGEIQDVQCAGRSFRCAPYHIRQVQDFQTMVRQHQWFRPTVYGDGLIAHIVRSAADHNREPAKALA